MIRHASAVFVALVLAAIAPAAQQDPDPRSWTFRESKDPMSDADRSFIIIGATSEGPKGQPRMFGWRCMADGFNVMFSWGRYMMGNSETDTISVQHRFPPDPPQTHRWDLTSARTVGFLAGRAAQQLTAQALKSKQIVLRANDRDGDSETATFNLEGAADALKQLSCYKPATSME